jgi:hypothetical protein
MSSAYGNWVANATVVAATGATVCLCVLIHYEGLLLASRLLERIGVERRTKVLYGIVMVLALHIIEIWIFGTLLWALSRWPQFGGVGPDASHLFDYVYFSATTFTTVGFGDLAAAGPLRFAVGTEALTGFVLITWSASFTFLEMEHFWRRR